MELLEKIPSLQKAATRKLRNVSETLANITAEQIEEGVTLEALQALNVPVFVYSTQVTIHGKLPEIDTAARQAGYKAIVKNGNGSIGVKYCGIDAEKKETLVKVVRMPSKEKKWQAARSSTETTMTRWYKAEELKQAREDAKSIPLEKMVASAALFRTQFGDIALVCEIKALPANHFEEVIAYFSGGKTVAELEEYLKQQEQKAREWHEAYQREAAQMREQAKEDQQKIIEELTKSKGEPLKSLPALPCSVIVAKAGAKYVYHCKKWGECVRYEREGGLKKTGTTKRAFFLGRAFEEGRVFAA